MDVYAQIAEKIIEGQEAIIGPVALEQAQHIDGLNLDWDHHKVSIKGNGAKIIDELVGAYRALFGQISVEVSKEAAGSLIKRLSPAELPEALK
jgi:hypothetical protein